MQQREQAAVITESRDCSSAKRAAPRREMMQRIAMQSDSAPVEEIAAQAQRISQSAAQLQTGRRDSDSSAVVLLYSDAAAAAWRQSGESAEVMKRPT